MELIRMTAFVLKQNEILDKCKNHLRRPLFERCVNYAKFLSRPLELRMFAPIDKDGNVLENPDKHQQKYKDRLGDFYLEKYKDDYKNYKQAKKRVLFEGFETEFHPNRIYFDLSKHNSIIYFISTNEFSSPSKRLLVVEDLLMYSDLTLTSTAIKEIQI